MRLTILLTAAALVLSGCAGMSDRQQRALTGTAAGTAGGGALIGAIAGNTAIGAAIGAGSGLVGGLIVDRVERDREAAYRAGYADALRD